MNRRMFKSAAVLFGLAFLPCSLCLADTSPDYPDLHGAFESGEDGPAGWSPMGRDIDGPEFLEGRMTSFLEDWFQTLGVPHRTVEVEPRRCNVVARYAGSPNRPVVMLDAHQDTVPVEGMVIPPFEPTEKGGRIYGRGSCDVKGGMASMLTAFARIVRILVDTESTRPTVDPSGNWESTSYYVFAAVEVVAMLVIIWQAWSWKE